MKVKWRERVVGGILSSVRVTDEAKNRFWGF